MWPPSNSFAIHRLPCSTSSLVVPSRTRHPQHKIDNDRSEQRNRQHRGTEAVIEPALPPHPDALCPPVERDQRIDHGRHGDQRKESRRDLAHPVAKVEQPDREPAEDDGKVEP